MRNTITYMIGFLIILGTFQGCYEISGEKLLTFETPLDSDPVGVFEIIPESKSTSEIPPGLYSFYGKILSEEKPTAKENLETNFPSKLYIKLERITPEAYKEADQGQNAKTINIELNINSQTGEIPVQEINIPKEMVIDPKKNESLLISMWCKGSKINAGDKLKITYWNKEAAPLNLSNRSHLR